jgi:hypothetical protein
MPVTDQMIVGSSAMMQQRSFTSSPYQYVDYPGSDGFTRCNFHNPVTSEPTPGSFNMRVPFHNFSRAKSNTRSLSAPSDAFDPWLLEDPLCGSPLSTSSSISHSESVATPLYTGLPMYDPGEQPFQPIRDDHITLTRETEPMWQPTYLNPIPAVDVNMCRYAIVV